MKFLDNRPTSVPGAWAIPLVAVPLLALLGGCDRPLDPKAPEVSSVTFASDQLAAAPGQTLQIEADVRDDNGQPVAGSFLHWESSDSTVAAITSSGVLTTRRPGSATITAAANGVSGQISIVVHGAGFHAWPDTVSMLPGGKQQLIARAMNPLGGANILSGPAWESSDIEVALVDANGLVTAVGTGVATVTATVGDIRISSEVSVFTYEQPLRFTSLTGDRQICGLTPEGSAYCWGDLGEVGADQPADRCESFNPVSNQGHLSRSTRRCSDLPVSVGRGLRFATLAAGDYGICGITSGGSLFCWNRESLPTQLAPGTSFRSVSVGHRAACAVSLANQGFCWGDNRYGVLGNGTTTSSSVPTPVSGGLEFATIDLSYVHACGLTIEGDAYCWGRNVQGELGVEGPPEACATNRVDCSTLPVRVESDLKFKAIEAGTFYSCALDLEGGAHCWGGSSSRVPKPMGGTITFTQLSATSTDACGLDTAGSVYCWRRGAQSVTSPSRLAELSTPMRSIHEAFLKAGIRDDGIAIHETQYCPSVDGSIRCEPVAFRVVPGQ